MIEEAEPRFQLICVLDFRMMTSSASDWILNLICVYIFLNTNKLFEQKLLCSAESVSGFPPQAPSHDRYSFLLGNCRIIQFSFSVILLTNEMDS